MQLDHKALSLKFQKSLNKLAPKSEVRLLRVGKLVFMSNKSVNSARNFLPILRLRPAYI